MPTVFCVELLNLSDVFDKSCKIHVVKKLVVKHCGFRCALKSGAKVMGFFGVYTDKCPRKKETRGHLSEITQKTLSQLHCTAVNIAH